MTIPPWKPTLRSPRLTRRLAVPWTDYAHSTPLADFTAALTELQRFGLGQGGCQGTSVWMNRTTFDHMRHTCNRADLYGRRSTAHCRTHLYSVNQTLTGDDLPAITIAPMPDGLAVMSEVGARGILLRVV